MTGQSSNPELFERDHAFMSHIGVEMTAWSEGRAVFELPLLPHLANRYGLPHGGVHATLLDSAMGFAGCFTGSATERQMAMTLNLSVNYLNRPAGTRLIAEGRQTGGGAKTFFAEGSVTDDTGRLIATGTGVFRYRARNDGRV